MNRRTFLDELRRGLRGLPPAAVDEILADYEAHFADAAAEGRAETEVAAALGDPARLARELRAEVGLRRWEAGRNPASAASAVLAVLGLATIDVFILAPILAGLGMAMFALALGVVGLFVGGGAVVVGGLAGAAAVPPGGVLQAALLGVGLMAAATAGGALLALAAVGLVNLLVRYARLHFRLIKPAAA